MPLRTTLYPKLNFTVTYSQSLAFQAELLSGLFGLRTGLD